MKKMIITVLALTTVGLTALQAASTETEFASEAVSVDGSIHVPENFRTDYVMLGAWSVAGDVDTGGEIGMHIVYSPREVVDAYRETGKFPDGAVLVKELFNTKTEDLTTGAATSNTDTAGYFVMVKDTEGRFPENALWGDGWGWSFFSATDTQHTTTKDYQAECLACHEPARATDLIYDYAYPVLRN